MFTGIVETLGKVRTVDREGERLRLHIFSTLSPKKLKRGTSVAVNGVCLTVECLWPSKKTFQVSLVPETLKRSHLGSLKVGEEVNLETSLRVGDVLAGHFVLGHVDFSARVLAKNGFLTLHIPKTFLRFFPEKGSVCVHGVSLTIAHLQGQRLSIALIPETKKKTLLGKVEVGDWLHVEIDPLARYLDSLTHSL